MNTKDKLPANYMALLKRLRGKVTWMRTTSALEKLIEHGLATATDHTSLGRWVELTHAGSAYIKEHVGNG